MKGGEPVVAEKTEIKAAYQTLVNVLIRSVKASIERDDLELCEEILVCAGEIMGNCAESLVTSGILSEEQALVLNDRLLDMEVILSAAKEEEEEAEDAKKAGSLDGFQELGKMDDLG